MVAISSQEMVTEFLNSVLKAASDLTLTLNDSLPVAPMPTFPALLTTRWVSVDDPTANAGPVMPSGLIDSCAHGDDVPTPKLDVKLFVPLQVLLSERSVEEAVESDEGRHVPLMA